LWTVVGIQALLAAAAAGLLAAVLAGYLRKRMRSWEPRLVSKIRNARAKLLSMSPPSADAILLVAGWLLFLVLTGIGNYLATFEQSTFFWSHIAGRALGIFRPEILVAVFCAALGFAYRAGWSRWAPLAPLGLCALTVAMIPPAIYAWPPTAFPAVVARNTAAMEALDDRLHRPLVQVSGPDEPIVYYGLAKTVVTGQDYLKGLR
jgi:hypothetical protein